MECCRGAGDVTAAASPIYGLSGRNHRSRVGSKSPRQCLRSFIIAFVHHGSSEHFLIQAPYSWIVSCSYQTRLIVSLGLPIPNSIPIPIQCRNAHSSAPGAQQCACSKLLPDPASTTCARRTPSRQSNLLPPVPCSIHIGSPRIVTAIFHLTSSPLLPPNQPPS